MDSLGNVRMLVANISEIHQAIEDGEVFTISSLKTALANNGTHIIRIRTGSKRTHFVTTVASSGKATFNSIIGATGITGGTAYTPFNRNSVSSKVYGGTVIIDPTFSGGTVRGQDLVNGSSGGQKVGGSLSYDLETILAPNTEMILRITNTSGTASDTNIIINMYED